MPQFNETCPVQINLGVESIVETDWGIVAQMSPADVAFAILAVAPIQLQVQEVSKIIWPELERGEGLCRYRQTVEHQSDLVGCRLYALQVTHELLSFVHVSIMGVPAKWKDMMQFTAANRLLFSCPQIQTQEVQLSLRFLNRPEHYLSEFAMPHGPA